MSVVRRRSILVAVALVLLLGGLYAAYWFHAAGQLRKGVEDFAAHLRGRGAVVELGQGRLFGFPAEIGLDLGTMKIEGGGWSWRAEHLRLVVPALDPLHPVLDLGPSHTLALPDGSRALLTAASARASLRVDWDGDLGAFSFESESPALERPGAERLTAEHLSIGYDWLTPPDAEHQTPSARFTLAARGVDPVLPPGLPLERRLARLELEGRILGTIPETTPLAALAAWSNDGGSVEIDRLAADWAALSVEADGTLAFDPALQPLLALTARLRGWKDTMQTLIRAEMIEPGMAAGVETLLAILSRPDSQGRPTLTVSINFQDGALYVGQLKVAVLPPLPIPAPVRTSP